VGYYATERVSERCQIKAKDSEGQYEEQRLNLCGEFLGHAFKSPPITFMFFLFVFIKVRFLFLIILNAKVKN